MSDRKKSLREIRHVQKTFYVGKDPVFYESLVDRYQPNTDLADIVGRLVDCSGLAWSIHRKGVWSHVGPTASAAFQELPAQGWKIHISATEGNYREILSRVAPLLLARDAPFKFANDLNTLKLMTSKRWPRGGSGKFITIYPKTDSEFAELIEVAYLTLKGEEGSYILSDNRYKDCRCLYYRYGGIRQSTRLDFTGRRIPILKSPAGDVVDDLRNPYFEVPSWLDDPFPRDEDDQEEMTLNEGRFTVEGVLWFSNTGGIYSAIDTTNGARVIVKEARPHVELGDNGMDATSRLKIEENALTFLMSTESVPAVVTSFKDWENSYLVQERLDAWDIREIMLTNSPLLKVNPTRAQSQRFYDICKTVFVGLMRAVDRAHKAGMILGDLAPTNVLVDKATFKVYLIDLESAFIPGKAPAGDIYTPGFRPINRDRSKTARFEDDVFAVGAIMMYCMFPMVAAAHLRPDLFSAVLRTIIADIGWTNTPVLSVIDGLCTGRTSISAAIDAFDREAAIETPYAQEIVSEVSHGIVSGLSDFIRNSFRSSAEKSIFPCDPYSEATGFSGFGFGSSGVIYALQEARFDIPPEILLQYHRGIDALVLDDLAPGFLTGAAGIGFSLIRGGDHSRAERFVQRATDRSSPMMHHSMYYGEAGIGLAALAAFNVSGSGLHLQEAIKSGELLRASAIRSDRGYSWSDSDGVRIGFGYGQSGVALFLLRLSQVTENPDWREIGMSALQYDLSFATDLGDGVTSFACSPEEDRTYEHYIEQGTAGIAKVAIRYGLWDWVDRMLVDVCRKYSAFAGHIYGLSGLVDVLVDAYVYSRDEKYLRMANRPLSGIVQLHLFASSGGLATPGEDLFRVSCDFATGVAGVLRTIDRFNRLSIDLLCLDEIDFPSGEKPPSNEDEAAPAEELA